MLKSEILIYQLYFVKESTFTNSGLTVAKPLSGNNRLSLLTGERMQLQWSCYSNFGQLPEVKFFIFFLNPCHILEV